MRDSAWIFVKNSEQIKNKPRLLYAYMNEIDA